MNGPLDDNLLDRLRDPSGKPVCAAPLAGWTDDAYREILRRCGARHLWIPFVSSHAVARGDSEERDRYVDEVSRERGHVQIFGADPEVCATAARILADAGARSIDLNCGCSVPKVRKGGGGSVLLRDLDLLAAILKAIIDAVDIPVSLKTRIGYLRDDTLGLDACRIAADLGCSWVTLHGRTAKQGFEGEAKWEPIAELASELSVPVIGNGDILTPDDARRMFDQTGCAGVMIGRGLMGDPWLVDDCERFLRDGTQRPDRTRAELVEIMLVHQRRSLDFHPDKRGVWEFRKHIARYLRGFPQAARLRAVLVRLDDPAVVTDLLRQLGEGRPPERIAQSAGLEIL
jgi:tRNA-dihydrouridine synthase B